MGCARSMARLSYAQRRKVGAILVSPSTGIIAEGVNGMPSGFDNDCEAADGSTRPGCLHAESNAIMKVARSTNSSVNATLYTTLSPCFECAKLIIQAGVTRVVYQEKYPYEGRTGSPPENDGIQILRAAGVTLSNLPDPIDDTDDLEQQDEGLGYAQSDFNLPPKFWF